MKSRKQKPGKFSLRLEWIDPATLGDNPANWRHHPQTQLDAIDDVLADPDIGWAGVLLYNERTKRLIDGHARKSRWIEKNPGAPAPVLIGSWSEDAERKILLTLDPLADLATPDTDKLKALFESTEFDDRPLAAATAELERLLANVDAKPPTEFVQFDASIKTEHQCPKCGYQWSGQTT